MNQSDVIYGGAGDDVLHGAGGKDELDGGDNTDFLDGGADVDVANGRGGAGNPLVPAVSGWIAETEISCY